MLKRLLSSAITTRILAVALTLAAIFSAIATYTAITRSESPFGPDPRAVLLLVIINLVLLLALTAVVARRGAKLWADLRQGSVGSRLQTRIVAMFSLITIVPTVIVAVFSALFFNYGIQSWFDTRVRTALEESVTVAKSYLEEHKETIRLDALAMANDLNREMRGSVVNQMSLNQLLSSQVALRSLMEAIIVQRGRIVAQSALSFSLAFERMPPDLLTRAEQGEVVIIADDPDRVRALVKLAPAETYLLIGRLVDSKVVTHMSNTQGAVSEYNRLYNQISRLQIEFSVVFVLVALLLLLAAIWYGMHFATRLMTPIASLIGAAERVRAGDFSTRVEPGPADDEVGTLARAFNRMTSQLEMQRSELVEANRKLDERRRFTEAVLGGVSAGIIALNRNQTISLYNRTAANLLAVSPEESMQGKRIIDYLPSLADALEEAERKPEKIVQDKIILTRDSKSFTLDVKVSTERFNEEIEGFIVTFDDITQLMVAQRNAAWADVARRIAHEIKNPLTPIQLATERLKKKYLKFVEESEVENFIKYTDTISKHVADIGKMVEEFVSFARMPAPVFKEENLSTMLKRAVFSEQVAHPDTTYTLELPEAPLYLVCDESQISRVLLNLLKNAAESIESRQPAPAPGHIIIRAAIQGEGVKIEICDNGPGFPPELLHKLMDPYVTTRARGTGLGLSIAKKSMEDHKGTIQISNLESGGACVTLFFSGGIDINTHNKA